jgi:dUTP pyrophosphatase
MKTGYTGSIHAVLYNHGQEAVAFNAGDKVCQLVVLPCVIEPIELVDDLEQTERGDAGFGSTGR